MRTALLYWSFGYGLYNMSEWLISGVNWLSVEVTTLNFCVQSNFTWNSDVSVWISNDVTFCALSNYFQFKCTEWSNAFLDVMPVEIKLAVIFELWSDLLPAQILHVGLSKLYSIGTGFLFVPSWHQLAAVLSSGGCIATTFNNGFELKLDLNPGSAGTNLFLYYLFTKTASAV